MKNIRVNDKFLNKISGKTVKAAEVNQKSVTLDTGENISKEVLFSDCFKYIGNEDDMPYMDEIATISYGAIVFNDNSGFTNPVMGDIHAEGILATYAGNIVFTAASKKECLLDIARYDVAADKFLWIAHNLVDVEPVYDNHRGIYAYKTISSNDIKISNKNDGKTETVSSYDESVYVMHEDERIGEWHANDVTFGDTVASVLESPDHRSTAIFVNDTYCLREMQNDEGYTFKVLPSELPENYSGTFNMLVINEIHSSNSEEDNEATYYDVMFKTMNGRFVSAVPVFDGTNNSYLIHTNDGIVFTNSDKYPRYAKGADVLRTIEKYPYLVKTVTGRHHNEFVLANKQYETAKISVDLTADRGYVTKIDE